MATVTPDFSLDLVMERVASRMNAPEYSQLDIYIWADGRVTGPPTGNEPDEGHLVALVTPTNGDKSDLDEIRQSIVNGMKTAPDEPDVVPQGSADYEELPPEESDPDAATFGEKVDKGHNLKGRRD